MTDTCPLVVLISGNGSNLQALIDRAATGFPFTLRAVISSQPEAFGLTRAAQAHIPARMVSPQHFPDRESYDQALWAAIDAYQPALVVLAGFMRILTPAFVQHYRGRLLNIHPSLLPKFRGLETHRRVLEAGEAEHGATIHFVTEELDGGPLILQSRVPVFTGDNPQTLAARVLIQEHRIYPLAVRWFAEGRLVLGEDERVWLDGLPLAGPVRVEGTGYE
ncbi:MAG: phosphoribosylglycinamide formyltransferase [Pseudomonadota bacterium]